MSTSFSWKRKAGGVVSKTLTESFEKHSRDEEESFLSEVDRDWLSFSRPAKDMKLEDSKTKSERLRREGVLLAESERYWEAVKKWDEAISFTPHVAKLHEMKAQALLILLENQPAAVAAQQAIDCEPTWWVAHQTLGRVHLSMGEILMAVGDFQKAIHLNPTDKELWVDDLCWSLKLLMEKCQRDRDLSSLPDHRTTADVDSESNPSITSVNLLDVDRLRTLLSNGNDSSNT